MESFARSLMGRSQLRLQLEPDLITLVHTSSAIFLTLSPSSPHAPRLTQTGNTTHVQETSPPHRDLFPFPLVIPSRIGAISIILTLAYSASLKFCWYIHRVPVPFTVCPIIVNAVL